MALPLHENELRFLQTLFPRRTEDGTIMPPNPAGFYHKDGEMMVFAQTLVEAGLIEPRGVDSCETAWFWPIAFNEMYEAVRPLYEATQPEASSPKNNLNTIPCKGCNKSYPREDLLQGDGSFIGWCIECDSSDDPVILARLR